MSNYSLVINSQFHPFTYQELLQPALMATEAHHNIEDQYADLATKSSVWEGLANEQTDPKTYRRYKAYADELQEAANSLADYGLTPTSRQTMANMRARYASQILPIQNAYQTRLEQAKAQRQALNQNPTLLLSRRAATTSLDDYMDNPMLDYESYSGALLTQQVAQMADKLKGELTSYSTKPLDKFTNLFLQKHGLSSQEVLNAINNPNAEGSGKILNAMVNDVIESSGMKNWADEPTMKQAYRYAWQGAWNAIGQTNASTFENKQAVLDAELANKKALIDYQRQLTAQDEAATLSPNYNTRNVLTQKEETAQSQQIADWNKYKKYFYKNSNGHWQMTAEGRRLASDKYEVTDATKGELRTTYRNAFGAWAHKNGLDGMAGGHTGSWQSGVVDRLNNLSSHYVDASKATEYTRQITPSQYDNVAAVLNGATRDGKLQTYDVSNDRGKYTLKQGKSWDASGDLSDKNISSAQVVYGQAGNYLEVMLKGQKEKIRIPLAQINSNLDNMITANLHQAGVYGSSNLKAVQMANGLWYTPQNAMMISLNNAGDDAISVFGTAKSKDKEVEQGEY